MNIHNADIAVSAVRPAQYPSKQIPEVALAGRSNVGKSSFLNKIMNRKKLARTSATPGKTAQINFYNIDDCIHIVDLPGYGYAAVSKQEKKKWGAMIEEYLSTRQQLRHTILLVDSRHKPTADDIGMAEWIRYNHGYLIVFATKTDKLSKKKVQENLEVIYNVLEMTDEDILIPFSAESGEGKEDAWEIISQLCEIENPLGDK